MSTLSDALTWLQQFVYRLRHPEKRYVLAGSWRGLPVYVTMTDSYGLCVQSLTWGSVELLSFYRGRFLQTAWQIDDEGEDNNPTEEGSKLDPSYRSSTQVISAQLLSPSEFVSTVRPGYWNGPRNGRATSPHVLSKRVTLVGNLLTIRGSITMAEPSKIIRVEGITGYMSAGFNRWRDIDGVDLPFPFDQSVVDLRMHLGPVICSRPDGISIGFAHRPSLLDMRCWYGNASFVPKGDSAWFETSPLVNVPVNFTALVAVGMFDDVVLTLRKAIED